MQETTSCRRLLADAAAGYVDDILDDEVVFDARSEILLPGAVNFIAVLGHIKFEIPPLKMRWTSLRGCERDTLLMLGRKWAFQSHLLEAAS